MKSNLIKKNKSYNALILNVLKAIYYNQSKLKDVQIAERISKNYKVVSFVTTIYVSNVLTKFQINNMSNIGKK